MELFEKIMKLYPSITPADFRPLTGTIVLRNDHDGNGPYIAAWNHPTLPRPTQEQLDQQ